MNNPASIAYDGEHGGSTASEFVEQALLDLFVFMTVENIQNLIYDKNASDELITKIAHIYKEAETR